MDKNRDSALQSQNEDNFATFSLGLEFLNEAEKRKTTEILLTISLKAMLHEAIFLATCNATNVALQVARKTSRVTPHFATTIVALRVARKVERPSTFRSVARQVTCV